MSTRRQVDRALVDVGDLLEEHRGHTSREELAHFEDDPVGFDLKAGREPADYQREIMESVARNKLTAWRGAHGCGKEFTIGSLAVWAAYVRGMLVLIVSATERQVLGQTMREVRKAWRAARKAHGIGGQLFQGSVRIRGEDRIVALTGSANVDALTGWHDADNGVLVAISEGQGEKLEDVAYDAAFGNVTTERGRILSAGNPVRPVGRFYEIHQRAHWERFKTSAFDTPNVKAGEVVRPGFPAPDWPAQIAREYGEESPFYVGRVLAEFPDQDEDALVKREWLDAAVERWEAGDLEYAARDAHYVLGVDPAWRGADADLTVVCLRKGPIIRDLMSWRGLDTMESAQRIAGIVRAQLSNRRKDTREPGIAGVYVDRIGTGAGVLDRLEELLNDAWWQENVYNRAGMPTLKRRKVKVEGFAASKKAHLSDRFVNLKAQAYWRLRKELEEGRMALPPNDALREELMATRVRFTANGKVEIEGKDELKKRIGRSPDLADALVHSLAPMLDKGFTRRVRVY